MLGELSMARKQRDSEQRRASENEVAIRYKQFVEGDHRGRMLPFSK